MNEKLKAKLYDYEINPPEKIWSDISASLDEETHAAFPKRLKEIEIVPADKVWDQITKSLDKSVEQTYSTKLSNLEIDPPIGTWEKISTAIQEQRPAPQISSGRRINLFIKYAAAACLIGVVATAAFYFFNSKKESSIVKTSIAPKKNAEPVIPGNGSNSAAQVPALSNNLPNEGTSPATTATITSVGRKKNPVQETSYMAQLVSPSVADDNSTLDCAFQEAVLHGNVPGNCSSISDGDPYLMFANADGYLTRISKKLAEALGCVYTRANSNPCEEQLKKWRDKVAQSPANSSPDNFMDLLDIIKSIRE
jgi:hypothetical protein